MPKNRVRFGLGWLLGLGSLLVVALVAAYSLRDELGMGDRPRIGVVEVIGSLERPEPILDLLVSLRRDSSIKAVILRIDSPGGAVAPFQEIHREVLRTRESKKVIASLGTVAASGGYYVAAAADMIVASPGTATGSIGVIMPLTNLKELLDKLGIGLTTIKAGKFKDAGIPNRPLNEEEREVFQELVDNIHQQFISDVAQGRGLEGSKVKEVADGRILTGEQALALGLVDRLGNFQDAVALAGSLAGLKGEPETVWVGRRKESWLGRLAKDVLTRSLTGLLEGADHGPGSFVAPR